MISYLSDVLTSIHYISQFLSYFLFACTLALYLWKYSINVDFPIKKFIIATIVCTVITIFVPANLKYDIVKQYQENNLQLQKQVIEMQTVVAKYKLQKELEVLRESN